MNFQEILNELADKKISCTIKGASFGWATIFRYAPLLATNNYFIEHSHECYVFEIGLNCGDVFSVNLVKSINITANGAEIVLKG